jgi:hypothetical protein
MPCAATTNPAVLVPFVKVGRALPKAFLSNFLNLNIAALPLLEIVQYINDPKSFLLLRAW